jgi:rhodanese-related sulfurtransferase
VNTRPGVDRLADAVRPEQRTSSTDNRLEARKYQCFRAFAVSQSGNVLAHSLVAQHYGHFIMTVGQKDLTASQPAVSRGIDDILTAALVRLRRLCPQTALEAFCAGAVLVDIRPAAQRAAEGEIAGALVVERCSLEWRFDPTSDTRLPEVTGFDVQVTVVCSEGSASTLAAAAQQDLGLHRATAVIGGYQAWRAAGLPTTGAA